jgi:hypothetical protein
MGAINIAADQQIAMVIAFANNMKNALTKKTFSPTMNPTTLS